jgi:hypothetical protein
VAGSVDLKAQGLKLSPNALSLPEGSLTEAENVVIRRENVIEPTRGFKVYGNTFGSVGDLSKQLLVYKNRILRHYGDTLEFDSGQSVGGVPQFEEFDDNNISDVVSGLRIKGIEASGNFLFTTGAGIKKISATNASEFSTSADYITKAGGLKALDVSGYLKITPGDLSGFLPQDSKVAYRVLWSKKDVNGNLIAGTPSERLEISNPALYLLLSDYARLLNALDVVSIQSGSVVNDADYTSTLLLGRDATAGDLRTNLVALAEKLDREQGDLISTAQFNGAPTIAAGVCTINIDANVGIYGKFSVGDKVYLSGVTADAGTLNGVQTVSSVTATTFTFSTSATGTAAISGTASIQSGWFRSITEPEEPSIPATNDELVALQTYFSDILTELQSERNVKTVAHNTATTGVDPFEISTVGIAASTVTVNRDTTGDPRDNLVTSDLVYLSGKWLDSTGSPVDFSGVQTVASTTATTFTMTIAGLTNPGVIDSTTTVERILRFTTTAQTTYLSDFVATSAATVQLSFSIPPDATTDYFYGIYRSSIATATGTTVLADLQADDEMQLVYEDYVTAANISAGQISVLDETLDIFRGAFLYTNSFSGEGLLQANDVPPLAKDIAIWRNYVFYSNTQTRHRLNLSLLGVSFLIDEATAGRAPKLVVATEEDTNIYTFVLGVSEVRTVQIYSAGGGAGTTNTLNSSGTANYFEIYNAADQTAYYVWFKIGTATDPAVSGKTGIPVIALSTDTNTQVAAKLCTTLKSYINDFTATVSTDTVTITNIDVGITTNASSPSSKIVVTTTVPGVGEDASTQKILLSEDDSAGQAVDITARSMVRVINKNASVTTGELPIVSAFYLSGPSDVPGKMLLEGRSLDTPKFYVIADTVNTGTEEVGDSFSPILKPTNLLTTPFTSVANPSVITSTAHGLLTNDQIVIVNSDSTPNIDGVHTVTRLTANTFSIPVNVTVAATQGSFTKLSDTLNVVASDNEISPNRIYYSKVSQPEAVPILNYIDLGPKDKAIVRIAPLRDSLLVYKEDGLYRISGEVAPFTNEVSDSSIKITAPDSLAVMNNLCFAWTLQGIQMTSDSGSNIISRDIDPLILPKASYANFSTITWGVGYESDNTYRVWTVDQNGDDVGTVCLMYNMISGSWTTLTNSATCGVVNPFDEKLYLGAGDLNVIEQERKDFTRLDYTGREYEVSLGASGYLLDGTRLRLDDVSNIEAGDVLVQNQYLTVYEYNQLLKKLDLDLGINDPTFETDLEIAAGDNLRTAVVALATKLDTEALSTNTYASGIATKTATISGISVATNSVITTSAPHELVTGRVVLITSSNSSPTINGEFEVTVLSSTTFSIQKTVLIAGTSGSIITVNENFKDVSTCYNNLISKLNADSVVQFANYDQNTTTTIQESIVDAVNEITNVLDVNTALPVVQGDFTVYKAISRVVTYSPVVFDNPVSFKHLTNATMMFENKNFTRAILSFATDLLPAFVPTAFTGLGNGIFGHSNFGENFFGGLANNTPFRTYIPRNCARCRFIVAKFEHKIAREGFAIFGLSISGNTNVSERAYRV